MAALAIIQARMGSTRLPGKVMLPLCKKPVLWHVIERVRTARQVNYVLVATTMRIEDNTIENICKKWKVMCFRGDSQDVLKRYYDVMEAMRKKGQVFDYLVRITADCPLMDPDVIDTVVTKAYEGKFEYATNTDPPTYPDGLDVEVFTPHSLEVAYHNARLASEREHVTPYIRKDTAMKKVNIMYHDDLSSLRWTLDTASDYKFIQLVYENLYREGEIFSMADVLELLRKKPELRLINNSYQRNEGYLKSLEEDRMRTGV
jgi:spore coat polysaccharide biosynthesis protein SpsF